MAHKDYLEFIVAQFSADWDVEKDGTMVSKKNGYTITADRLGENWLNHMAEKNWVDMNTFTKAYIYACAIAHVDSVKIGYVF